MQASDRGAPRAACLPFCLPQRSRVRDTLPSVIRERAGKLVVTAFYGRDATGKRRSRSASVEGTSKRHWAMARRLEDRLLSELQSIAAASVSPAGADPTIADLLDAWKDVARLEASTLANVESIIRVRIKPRLGAKRVRDLTVGDLDRFYLDLERGKGPTGRPLAPASVVRTHGILHTALKRAVRWGIVDRNVAEQATVPELPRPDPRPPGVDRVAKLYCILSEEQPTIAIFLRMAAATGARRGEMCAIRWRDVDLDAGIWRKSHAIKQYTGGTYIGPTKTNHSYALALDPTTVADLRKLRDTMVARASIFGMTLGPDAFVFSEEVDCSGYMKPNTVSNRILKARQDHGLMDVRLKELRHFAATTMLANGVDARTAAARLGHARTSTLTDIYAAWTAPADRAAAVVLGGILDETLGRRPTMPNEEPEHD